MNFLDNITFRRTRRRSEPTDDETGVVSQTLNCTTSSLPDISEDEDVSQIKLLKDEISKLSSQLASAHIEIEVLSLENTNLKKLNDEYNKKNDMYKKIVNSPAKIKPKTMTPKRNMKTKHTQTTQTIDKSQLTINNITETISKVSSTSPMPNIGTSIIVQNQFEYLSKKPKICLISCETSNRLFTLIESTNLTEKYETCHYRKPKCGLRQSLDGIEGKVKGFTYSDFCIIYIGEEDFCATHNYIDLVMLLRDKLLNLTHTNFIICLPTFRYMRNANIMFNSRIETFNNLLYLDVNSFGYAHLLDSNLNLPYDHGTYNKHYGSLNKYGLKIVVSDLQDLILALGNLNTSSQEVDCSPETQSLNEIPKEPHQINSQFFL